MSNGRHTKKQARSEQILRHGFALQRIFPKTKGMGPVALCKSLHRLESEAHSAAERYSSYPTPEGYIEKKEASILKRLDQLLGYKSADVPVFVNLDPRGYALKIDDGYARNLDIHKDWGGYGILCPEF